MTDFIEIYDNAMPRELCAAVANQFESSQTHRGQTGGGVVVELKDSQDINISRAADWRELNGQLMRITTSYMLKYLMTYPYLLTGAIGAGRLDPVTGESTYFSVEDLDESTSAQLMKKLYRPGEIIAQQYTAGSGGYHHWHSEIYPRDSECETLHRVLLFMFYINTVTDGGETEFLYQQKKVRPQAGRMVIAPAGFTHTHKGHVPVSEDKLILTSWVLFNRAERIYQ